MKKRAKFKSYDPEQLFLLPPDIKDWLEEDDLAYFIMDVVNSLNLDGIYASYDGTAGGQPAYDPPMMVSLLLYGYCKGVISSRKIEQATYHSVPFRVIAGNRHPDHDTMADFRKRHLKALSGLFVDVLRLCRKAGLVKFGHVSLDGTKMKGNASKRKAMSYGCMEKRAADLKKEVAGLLAAAEKADNEDDGIYGKGKRGDELPEDLRFKESRLRKIEEAKRALEEEALAEAAMKQEEYEIKRKAYDDKSGPKGRPPAAPSGETGHVNPKKQRNFTDPESRLMPVEGGRFFVQGYNCQAAVDERTQIIVASNVTVETNDKEQLAPGLEKLKSNTGGVKPKHLSADSGYSSGVNIELLESEKIDGYIATTKQKHSDPLPASPRGRIPKNLTTTQRMTRKLQTVKSRFIYAKRKHIVEPVFGQIKEARGFRRFSFRGLDHCQDEWDLVCLTHNLLKLFRYGKWKPRIA
ncbi:MAG: IS1182 family transposase [bacterium]|nr:IS1182 family transposase [bacterium]